MSLFLGAETRKIIIKKERQDYKNELFPPL